MRTYNHIWVSPSFEARNMNDLWDRYNAEPELQAKVDALFEAQVAKGSPYYQTLETYRNNGEKRRKVWVFDNGLSISRMPVRAAWEILIAVIATRMISILVCY